MAAPPQDILLAGASGRLGRYLVRELHSRGHRVTALTRDRHRVVDLFPWLHNVVEADLTRPATLRDACAGITTVFSCAGASLAVPGWPHRHSFHAVDFFGNQYLLAAAQQAGVDRFGYVSVFGGPGQRHLAYSDAHERFAEALLQSGIPATIIRPTGFFGFFADIFAMARRGVAIQIGNGASRTNPIHEADLAVVCADALAAPPGEIDAGGPEVLTRRRTVELAFEALARPARILSVPPFLFRSAALMARPVHPRVAHLLAFGTAVSTTDVIAPAHGVRRLDDYYRDLAGFAAAGGVAGSGQESGS